MYVDKFGNSSVPSSAGLILYVGLITKLQYYVQF